MHQLLVLTVAALKGKAFCFPTAMFHKTNLHQK